MVQRGLKATIPNPSGKRSNGTSDNDDEDTSTKREKINTEVTVQLPLDDDAYEADLQGQKFQAKLVLYIRKCDGYVVQRVGDGKLIIVRRSFIVDVYPLPSAPRPAGGGAKAWFTIRPGLRNQMGKMVGGKFTEAKVIHKIGEEAVLLRLIKYDKTCFFSGYEVCLVKDERWWLSSSN